MQTITISILGRPNVGKSSLFNRLVSKNQALSHHSSGTTVDRICGVGRILLSEIGRYLVVDTMGLDLKNPSSLAQLDDIINDSSAIILLLDGKEGIVEEDREIIKLLSKRNIRFQLVANKADPGSMVYSEGLGGFGEVLFVSAAHNLGITNLVRRMLRLIKHYRCIPIKYEASGFRAVRLTVIGRQNAGKSSTLNSLMKQARHSVSSAPGTTRDVISSSFRIGRYQFTLNDTGGFKRESRIKHVIGRQAVLRANDAIRSGHVMLLVVDLSVGLSALDFNLFNSSQSMKRTTILVFNKCDLGGTLKGSFSILPHTKVCYVSALKHLGLNNLLSCIVELGRALYRTFPVSLLNQVMARCIAPELRLDCRRHKIRLDCLHQAGNNPISFVVHGRNACSLSSNQLKHISNIIRKKLNLEYVFIDIRAKSR